MYLSKLNISNFRKLKQISLEFEKGLNVIVGANNIGKSAVVDALRALLTGFDGAFLRLTVDDVYTDQSMSEPSPNIMFHYIFDGLSLDDEADFLPALIQNEDNSFEAHFYVSYMNDGLNSRLRVKRWCGKHEEIGISSDMMENIRGVYLQPLRDASKGLMPGRNSRLSHLIQLLSDENSRQAVEEKLGQLDSFLTNEIPIADTRTAVINNHENMLGQVLAQSLELDIGGADFRSLSSRLSLYADKFDIEQNGLGYNNLIYMAVVLCELAKDPYILYRGLIIEEPEAHLHPQLQAILLDYLENIKADKGEGHVQVFVTSHSPNFGSIAQLNSITCLVDVNDEVKTFFPRKVNFEPQKREKLERYLDVTRAEIFFARRIIFVEGTAELMLINIFGKMLGEKYDLRKNGVSVISVDGLNFDSFLPLFGRDAISIPVAVITDADPIADENDDLKSVYPDLNEDITVSSTIEKMKKCESDFVKIFYGVKTFEYDLALHEKNREKMLTALESIHPQIGAELRNLVNEAQSNRDKARELFCGMFERGKGKSNVKKGVFGQALAQTISSSKYDFIVPDYIENAIKFVCDYKK